MRMEELMLGGQGQLGVEEQVVAELAHVAHVRGGCGCGCAAQHARRMVKQLTELVQRRAARIQSGSRVEVRQEVRRRRQGRAETHRARVDGREESAGAGRSRRRRQSGMDQVSSTGHDWRQVGGVATGRPAHLLLMVQIRGSPPDRTGVMVSRQVLQVVMMSAREQSRRIVAVTADDAAIRVRVVDVVRSSSAAQVFRQAGICLQKNGDVDV